MKIIKPIALLMLLFTLSPRLLPAQTTESYTFTTNRLVPDGNLSGLSDARYVPSAIGNISSLQVRLKITGEFNGDLYAYLRNTNGFVVLLNRVGATASNPSGYGDSGFNVTFQTAAANGDIHVYQNVTNPPAGSPLTGVWQPDGRTNDPATVTDLSPRTTSLSNFNGFTIRRHQYAHGMGIGHQRCRIADTDLGQPRRNYLWHGIEHDTIERDRDLQLHQCARHVHLFVPCWIRFECGK
jgi:hypothetical protein